MYGSHTPAPRKITKYARRTVRMDGAMRRYRTRVTAYTSVNASILIARTRAAAAHVGDGAIAMPEGVLQGLHRGNPRRVVVRIVTVPGRCILERRKGGARVPQVIGGARPWVRGYRRDAPSMLAAELAARSHVRHVAGGSHGAGLDLERELAHLMIAHRAQQQDGVARGAWVRGASEMLRVAVRFPAVPEHLDQVQRDELDERVGIAHVEHDLVEVEVDAAVEQRRVVHPGLAEHAATEVLRDSAQRPAENRALAVAVV